MPAINILDQDGKVIDRVLVTEELAEQRWPGRWELAEWQPGPPPVVVPASVTMRQARIALHRAGLLSQVEATIAALPEPPRIEAELEWNFSNEVQRYNGFVAQIAPLLGLNEAAIDQLFITAASI